MSFVCEEATLTAADVERFSRQMMVDGVGAAGQAVLQRSHVVCIGVGGLGSTLALYLVAAGVGDVTLVDDDVVERSNLHRQVLHTDGSVGSRKVDSARRSCLALRPDARVHALPLRVRVDNVEALLRLQLPEQQQQQAEQRRCGGDGRDVCCDVVVDCSDNVATRYLVNDAAMRVGVPVVSGCAMRWEGQLSVYGYTSRTTTRMASNNSNSNNSNNKDEESDEDGEEARQRGPCYRCLFPVPPPAAAVGSCNDVGVMGAVPGLIGCMQASETIKVLVGCGEVLSGRMFLFDALHGKARVVRLRARQRHCPACSRAARRAVHVPLHALVTQRPEYVVDGARNACSNNSNNKNNSSATGCRCDSTTCTLPSPSPLPSSACCAVAAFATRMAECRSRTDAHDTHTSSSSWCVCVDVRVAVQYAMAHLPHAHSLPLSTLQAWQRAGELWPRWTTWLRAAVAHDLAQCAHTTTTTTTATTTAHDVALPRHCVVFVLCRRGIASVQATQLLLHEQQQQQQQQQWRSNDDTDKDSCVLPFTVDIVNVDGGLNAYHTDVDAGFPYY